MVEKLNGQIPQDHNYQIVLREYLSTLDESNFDLSLDPLLLDESYFNNDDDIFKAWLIWGAGASFFPSTNGLRVNSEHFTLGNIESNNQVFMSVGRSAWISSEQTAFFAEWDYPGNPHYNSDAVKLRAFVAAAVDMMMTDQAHDNGDGRRSDFLGGQLIMWAYPYGIAKDILPSNVKNAFEEGLMRMFEKVEEWGPTGTHADMDTRSAPGLLYTAMYVESEDLTQRAHDYIDRILDKHLKGAGYVDHGGAWDGGYNGISLYHLTWAGYLTDYPRLHDALNRMSKLKAYVSLPDPDGGLNSPNHSNSASAGSTVNDQWDPFFRDVGLATFSDHAIYTIKKELGDPSSMFSDMDRRIDEYINSDQGSQSFTTPSDSSPEEWRRRHWTYTNFNYASLYYEDGSYDRLFQTSEAHETPPMGRAEKFVESFDDKILSARKNSYGLILFNDRLSWWSGEGQTENLSGLGGGNLSAFWTKSTGTVILGVGRGLVFDEGHDLADWQTLPVHAISGETNSGQAFTSAFQRHPEAVYNLDGEQVNITMSGDLSNGFSDPTDGLAGEVIYQREFTLEDDGVRVRASIASDGVNVNTASNLYEILPVYRENSTSIEFEMNGSWQNGGTSEVEVSRIRLSRFDGEVYIEFEEPALVKVSPEEFYMNQANQSGTQIRNIMINLLDNGETEMSDQSIEYRIVTYEEIENEPNEPNEPNPEEPSNSEASLGQNFPNPFNPTTQISFELSEAQEVSLRVYDLAGRFVATLLEGTYNAGSHTATFAGDEIASGIYIYRLKTKDGFLQNKMTLIK